MITAEKKALIRKSLKTLVASHAVAVSQIESTISILSRTLELDDDRISDVVTTNTPAGSKTPLADRETLTVHWRDKSCFLGNTLLFWFFDRLAQSPNRYVSHVDLLDDVWREPRENSSIRGVVKRLRDRLTECGMEDLAQSIDGSVSGYYGLILV